MGTPTERQLALLLPMLAALEIHAGRSRRDTLALVGIPYRPSHWSPDRTAAQRKQTSRTLVAIEAAGLASRVRRARRTTHVRFTARGLAEALAAAGDSSDRTKIAAALSASSWATAAMVRLAASRPGNRQRGADKPDATHS